MPGLFALRGGGLGLLLGLLVACSGNAAPPAPAATTAPPSVSADGAAAAPPSATTASPTVTSAGPVDVERVLQHVRALAVDIGSRPAGTDAERRAAQYIAGVLTSQGYTTTIEPFTFRMRFDESTVALSGGTPLAGSLLEGSATGSASGLLVDGGNGAPDQIPAAAQGAVVLVRRGGISFGQKVANAAQAGARAVIIVNSEPGPLRGTLGDQRSAIPAVGIEGREQDRLRAALGQSVTVTASGGTRMVTSQNVVGRRGATCRAYIGSHYDSVPEGPGANDNATGTATMLEVARVRGTDGLCAIAFGSEEVGLRGSQAFVAQHLAGGSKFMVNFDMTGRIQGAIIVGDETLTQGILGILGRGPDQPLRAGSFPANASSDHVSFSAVGVPAVTITSGDDPNIHTPGDTLEAVRKADLATMVTLGDAAVAGLVKTLSAN